MDSCGTHVAIALGTAFVHRLPPFAIGDDAGIMRPQPLDGGGIVKPAIGCAAAVPKLAVIAAETASFV